MQNTIAPKEVIILIGFIDFENGSEIVYGVRSKRATDTAFKRMTAQGFYKVLSIIYSCYVIHQ